jgi:hypothetical protein
LKQLQKIEKDRFESVDGDLIAGRMTEQLGPERNAMTLARVWETVLKHKVPIISQGGGIFTEYTDEVLVCSLRARIEKIFRRKTNLVALIMKHDPTTNSVSEVADKDALPDLIDRIYDTSDEYMQTVLSGRIERYQKAVETGVNLDNMVAWTKEGTPPSSAMNERSNANRVHALAIAQSADHVFTVPYNMEESHIGSLLKIKGLDAVAKLLTPIPTGLTVGVFEQVRLVVWEKSLAKARHITLHYAGNGSGVDLSFEDIQRYRTNAFACSEDGLLPAVRYTLQMKPKGSDSLKDFKGITVGVIKPPRGSDDGALVDNAHVTEEGGIFPARLMQEVAKWMKDTSEPLVLKVEQRGAPAKEFEFEFQEASEVVQVAKNGKTWSQKIPANFVTHEISYTILGVAAFIHKDDVFSSGPKTGGAGAKKKK